MSERPDLISPEMSMPPDHRRLTHEGARVYLSGELSLGDQFSLWSWLHDLKRVGDVAEGLGGEAESYLQVLDEFPDVKAALFLSTEDEQLLSWEQIDDVVHDISKYDGYGFKA